MTNTDLNEELRNIETYIAEHGRCKDCGIDKDTITAILLRTFEIPEDIDNRRRNILQSVKNGKSYQQIADEYKVARQRIGQIVKDVCKKPKKQLPERNV